MFCGSYSEQCYVSTLYMWQDIAIDFKTIVSATLECIVGIFSL